MVLKKKRYLDLPRCELNVHQLIDELKKNFSVRSMGYQVSF